MVKIFRPYTPSSLGSIYNNRSLLPHERLTGARAILRMDQNSDGNHHLVRKPLGLHPSYIMLHGIGRGSQKEEDEVTSLLEDGVKDIFDAVRFFLAN